MYVKHPPLRKFCSACSKPVGAEETNESLNESVRMEVLTCIDKLSEVGHWNDKDIDMMPMSNV